MTRRLQADYHDRVRPPHDSPRGRDNRGLCARSHGEPARLAAAVRSAHPAAGAGGRLSGRARRADPALDRRLHPESSVDAHGVRRRRLDRLLVRVRHRVVLPLQTLSNLLAALRESDFSIRARGASGDDPLGGGDARGQRARVDAARSAARRARGRRAAAHGDGGDRRRRLHLRRRARAAARQPRRRAAARRSRPSSCSGRTADELGLRACLAGQSPRIEDVAFPGASGRWEVRRTTFRQGGRPHQLLVLADVSRPLRDEERQAWQRLIRVIGHEINNSLAPIKSIAGSLESMLARGDRPGRPDIRSLADRSDRGHEARPGRHRRTLRFAQPLHDRLRAPGEAAGAAARLGQRAGARAAHRRASRRGCRFTPRTGRTSASAPIPINSSSCSSTSCTTPRTPRCRPAAA